MRTNKRIKRGFTLVELTVVILIIGVIATIAAPKFFDSLSDAQDNSAVATLQVLRDGIELFKANNPAYPGADGTMATFKTDLSNFLRNDFPKCQAGVRDDAVTMQTDGGPLAADIDGATGWIYDNKTGEIRINHADYSTL